MRFVLSVLALLFLAQVPFASAESVPGNVEDGNEAGTISSAPVTCEDFILDAKSKNGPDSVKAESGCLNTGAACSALKGNAINTALDCVNPKVCCIVPSTAAPGGVASSTASGTQRVAPIKLLDPLQGLGALGILNRVISAVLSLLGVLALLVFVYAGVVYMTAGGSAERVSHSVNTMKYAIIGLGLITFSYVIILAYFRAIIGG